MLRCGVIPAIDISNLAYIVFFEFVLSTRGRGVDAQEEYRGEEVMASKLIIVMVNTDPRNPEELGAPFFQATVAAAMDYEVDVVCTATSGQFMKKGVAEKLVVKAGSGKTVYDFIKDAHEAGAKFYCCSPNLDLFDMTEADLIPECEGIVGGAKVMEDIMEDDDVRVLTY
jgi:predicted peroxiredoxin